MLFHILPYKGEETNSTVLYKFHFLKKAAFFYGLSWRVSHITVSWEELGLSHTLSVRSKNREATVKDTDVVAQMGWTCLPSHISPFPALIFPQRAQEGNCIGGEGCREEPEQFLLQLGSQGWKETESLVEPSADRQWTSSWPLRPQALL